MIVTADYTSVKTTQGITTFRYNTCIHSDYGPGNVIGLVYMMNPGSARPEDDNIFNKLQTTEYSTDRPIATKSDKTMKRVERLIKLAYKHNNIKFPKQYTIYIENLFNLKEENDNVAKKLARKITNCNELMFKNRELNNKFQFVWLAWGKVSIRKELQVEVIKKFPNAIIVNKMNYRGAIKEIRYPKHPRGMNLNFFLEASKGKIFI